MFGIFHCGVEYFSKTIWEGRVLTHTPESPISSRPKTPCKWTCGVNGSHAHLNELISPRRFGTPSSASPRTVRRWFCDIWQTCSDSWDMHSESEAGSETKPGSPKLLPVQFSNHTPLSLLLQSILDGRQRTRCNTWRASSENKKLFFR